jgi:hypothetical protein
MPLINKPSKKAFESNMKSEMAAGKPQDQALAIAYNVKRKKKKMASGGSVDSGSKDMYLASGGSVESGSRDMNMAEGGQINAKNARRPMPDNRYDDGEMIRKNSGNKAPSNDEWTSTVTIKQAQKPSITKLSQPKLVGSDAFSVRNRDMRDDENDLGDRIYPETDRAQPVQRDNEDGPNRQGPRVSDMAPQHNNQKPPYKQEREDQYSQDEASDNMKKKQSPPGRYAEGGPVMEPKDNHDELEERDDEAHMMDSLSPGVHGEQPASWRDELDADGSNPNPLDMEREHSNGRRPYARGGEVDLDNGQPSEEEDEEHYNSVAAAIMAKRKKMAMGGDPDASTNYDPKKPPSPPDPTKVKSMGFDIFKAEGGEINGRDSIYSDDSDQADMKRNAEEDANMEDQSSYDALRKENYSESAGLKQLDNPDDSGQHGDDIDSDDHDMIKQIRSKMNKERQFKRR